MLKSQGKYAKSCGLIIRRLKVQILRGPLELKLLSSTLSFFVVHAVHALVAEYYEFIPIPEPNQKVDDGANCEPDRRPWSVVCEPYIDRCTVPPSQLFYSAVFPNVNRVRKAVVGAKRLNSYGRLPVSHWNIGDNCQEQ